MMRIINGCLLVLYRKRCMIVEAGELKNRGGAAGRSSFGPTKIDRSHYLKKDQYHQIPSGSRQSFLHSAVCNAL